MTTGSYLISARIAGAERSGALIEPRPGVLRSADYDGWAYNEGCLAKRSTHESEQNQYVLLLK